MASPTMTASLKFSYRFKSEVFTAARVTSSMKSRGKRKPARHPEISGVPWKLAAPRRETFPPWLPKLIAFIYRAVV